MHYVSRLSEDPEPTVRVELMEKVPELSQRCIEKSEQLQLSSSLVEEEILPLVMNFLEDITNTARKGTVRNNRSGPGWPASFSREEQISLQLFLERNR